VGGYSKVVFPALSSPSRRMVAFWRNSPRVYSRLRNQSYRNIPDH